MDLPNLSHLKLQPVDGFLRDALIGRRDRDKKYPADTRHPHPVDMVAEKILRQMCDFSDKCQSRDNVYKLPATMNRVVPVYMGVPKEPGRWDTHCDTPIDASLNEEMKRVGRIVQMTHVESKYVDIAPPQGALLFVRHFPSHANDSSTTRRLVQCRVNDSLMNASVHKSFIDMMTTSTSSLYNTCVATHVRSTTFICSPLVRTWQTACLLANNNNFSSIQLIIAPALQEVSQYFGSLDCSNTVDSSWVNVVTNFIEFLSNCANLKEVNMHIRHAEHITHIVTLKHEGTTWSRSEPGHAADIWTRAVVESQSSGTTINKYELDQLRKTYEKATLVAHSNVFQRLFGFNPPNGCMFYAE